MIFRARSRRSHGILSHALSRVGTRQLAYMPSPGQNAPDENKGASARVLFTLFARKKEQTQVPPAFQHENQHYGMHTLSF